MRSDIINQSGYGDASEDDKIHHSISSLHVHLLTFDLPRHTTRITRKT
jgi:hypothetical protein